MQLVHKKKIDSDVRCTKFEHSILEYKQLLLENRGLFVAEDD